MNKNRIIYWITRKELIVCVYLLVALAASIQALLLEREVKPDGSMGYFRYNNYKIFENSYDHLVQQQDLYIPHPDDHFDLYKYTPTFSVFFGFFTIFPDWIGLTLWNMLNALLLLIAVYALPYPGNTRKGIALLLMLVEMMTAIQNQQSNGMMAGLLLLAFALLEKRVYGLASFLLVFSVFIKLFGMVGFLMFLFYPEKKKLIFYTCLWTLLLLALPLLFIGFNHYVFLLNSYREMLFNDHSISYGLSVMGWLHNWFGISGGKGIILAIGTLFLVLPLIRIHAYPFYGFRLLFICSVLIWTVIFNHKAESPTFIIAMTGVAVWFVSNKRPDLPVILLLLLAFIFTSLSPTDLFPRSIRETIVDPFILKAFPCILIWIWIVVSLLSKKKRDFLFPGQESSLTGG